MIGLDESRAREDGEYGLCVVQGLLGVVEKLQLNTTCWELRAERLGAASFSGDYGTRAGET
jgi:hypothetical protein